MKMKLVIREDSADLVVDAENEFELKMLKQCQELPQRFTNVKTHEEYGVLRWGQIVVCLSTNKPAEQP